MQHHLNCWNMLERKDLLRGVMEKISFCSIKSFIYLNSNELGSHFKSTGKYISGNFLEKSGEILEFCQRAKVRIITLGDLIKEPKRHSLHLSHTIQFHNLFNNFQIRSHQLLLNISPCSEIHPLFCCPCHVLGVQLTILWDHRYACFGFRILLPLGVKTKISLTLHLLNNIYFS